MIVGVAETVVVPEILGPLIKNVDPELLLVLFRHITILNTNPFVADTVVDGTVNVKVVEDDNCAVDHVEALGLAAKVAPEPPPVGAAKPVKVTPPSVE